WSATTRTRWNAATATTIRSRRCRRAARPGGAVAESPPRVPRDGWLPLTFPQERIWFLRRLAGDGAAYHFQMALRLRGRLDVGALERALTEVVRRHEILRTTFREVDGVPGQRVEAPFAVALPVTSLEDVDAADREAAAWRMVRRIVRGARF